MEFLPCAPPTHRVRVGFLTGRTFTPTPPERRRQLLPFYVNFRRWSLLPIYRLRNRNFLYRRAARAAGQATAAQHPAAPPSPGAPAPTFASVASRAPITRRFPPRRGRRRRPALRHPARSLGLRARGLARAWRVATFTILHRFCRTLHFYHFTPKVANFYRTLTLWIACDKVI